MTEPTMTPDSPSATDWQERAKQLEGWLNAAADAVGGCDLDMVASAIKVRLQSSPQPAPETDALDTMTADEWKAIARAWELQCHEAEANAAKVRDEALEDAAVECDNQSCLTRIATSPYAYAVNMARKCAGAIRALKSTASAQSADKGKEGGR